MAMCPLLREECIEKRCAWWDENLSRENEEYSQCLVSKLPDLLNDIANILEGGIPVSPDNW